MFHSVEDIAVAAAAKCAPYKSVGLERIGVLFAHLVEKERQDAVASYVFGYVLFSVVSAHLCTVVDILLEDVAKHIGVDILATGSDASVEMPTPSVEEVKKADKSIICNVNIFIVEFNLMFVEHTAIQIWNLAINGFKITSMRRGI